MSAPRRYTLEDDDAALLHLPTTTTDPPHASSSSLPPSAAQPSLTQLTTHWLSQRSAPELLPYPSTLLATLFSEMDQQQRILSTLSTLPPAEDDREREDEHLRLQCVALDLDRARWLVRSLLRCRLEIVQRDARWLQREVERGKARGRMSRLEKAFCSRYNALRTEHLDGTVLQFLPEQMRAMDDVAMGSSASNGGDGEDGGGARGDMVEKPDLDRPVFVWCREDCGTLPLPDGETAILAKDSIHFLRYRSVRHLLAQSRIQLV